MLGYSVSYFLSQYWRNVPLYAEKLIPLLDTCLSNGFVYSDKVAGAFYELTNKYQNTAALPLENLKEFIRENGYGYILDLMIQDEENIKMLWYLLVLIHQLKGSKEGLELVLSLFQEEYAPDTANLNSLLGTPTSSSGAFLTNKGASLLTSPLTIAGACPSDLRGWFRYTLPNSSHISTAGNYKLSWTNLSFNSLGKFNSMKITAERENTDRTVLYEGTNLLFTYPEKTIESLFTIESGDSPIRSLLFEYTCDNYNKEGACISGIKITKDSTTVLPVAGGVIESDGKFYENYPVTKAFQAFDITGTAPISNGEIIIPCTNVGAGTYKLSWDILNANLIYSLKELNVAIRYNGWETASEDEKLEKTLEIYNEEDLKYFFNNTTTTKTFRALEPVSQIVVKYTVISSNSNAEMGDRPVVYLSNFKLTKDSNVVTIKTIPSMTSKTTPRGSVVSNASFADNHEAYKVFNYTSVLGAVPLADGYVRYSYETEERPTAGDYTFTWANSSLDNNGYLTSLKAKITYIDDSELVVGYYTDLTPVGGKTRYFTNFTATNTIKYITIEYTSTYNSDGFGGSFSEANITKTQDQESGGTSISVWYESLPVSVENTFELVSSVDIGKTGSEFFYNFKNFVRHYVYPELLRLKVKYNLEGTQTPIIYSRSLISYESNLQIGNILLINTVPSDATVTMTYNGITRETKRINVESGTVVNYTITHPYYESLTETITVNSSTTLTKTLVEIPKYTVTLNPVNSVTSQAITGSSYIILSEETSSYTNQITVHDGTSISYTVNNPYYNTATGTKTVTASETVNVPMVEHAQYTLTFNVRDSISQSSLTEVVYSLTSVEGTSTTNAVTVHEGTQVNYSISKTGYITVTGSIIANSSQTVIIDLEEDYLTIDDIHDELTLDEMGRVTIRQIDED